MRAVPFRSDDWSFYEGAVAWPNGDPPIVREISEHTSIVCGSEAFEVFVMNYQTDEQSRWIYPYPFPTQRAAMAFADAIDDDKPDTLESFGLQKLDM